MYCSRRGRNVTRPTDTCTRCGRCHWEQNQETGKNKKSSLPAVLLAAAGLLLAAILLFLG